MDSLALDRVSVSVQPLVFETGVDEAPYSARGTVFFVGYKKRAYAIAARHSVWPDNLGPLCLFPKDGSRRILPLKYAKYIPITVLAEDFADLVLLEFDMERISPSKHGVANVINLDLPLPDWHDHRNTAEFVVLGYPEEHSRIDYDAKNITSLRMALRGEYSSPSPTRNVHTIRLLETKGLSSFSGFSGGPVLSWVRRIGHRPQFTLCGMAIRGTPLSGLMHFIDLSVIKTALHEW